MTGYWRFQFVFNEFTEQRRWRWVLLDANETVVADSAASFASRDEAEQAASAVAANAAGAEIEAHDR